MSFESDLNQYCVYERMKEEYRIRLNKKYVGRTFTVLTPPFAKSHFRVGESYSIDGFSVYNNETYIINREGGMNRTIRMCEIRLNSLDKPVGE